MLIDVSNHQGSINWAVTDPVIDGAYLKVTEGTGFVDGTWRANHDQAAAGGRPVGPYHFADLGDPVAEANHFADQVLTAPWQLRPVLDIETAGASAGWIVAFRAQFRARTNTRAFRVYTSRSFLQNSLNPAGWIDPDTDIWAAAYGSTLGWDHPQLVLWQNTESASVPGVLGSVDADQFMHGWTPATDLGAPDMQLTDTYTDWAGNTQTVQATLNHLDQKLTAVTHSLFDPGSEIAHDPTKTKTNLHDVVLDMASWILAQNAQLAAIQGALPKVEADLLAAVKGVQAGTVDVAALAAAIGATLPAAVVADLGAKLAAK